MTKNHQFLTARRFYLWNYIVSHHQLLLRSPKSVGCATRMEILFKDVSLIYLETDLDGLSISEVARNEDALPIDVSRISPSHKLFRLTTKTTIGYIAAAAFCSSEDDKEYYDKSALIAAEHL